MLTLEEELRSELARVAREQGADAAFSSALNWLSSEPTALTEALRILVAIRALPGLSAGSLEHSRDAVTLLKGALRDPEISGAIRREALFALFGVPGCMVRRDPKTLHRRQGFSYDRSDFCRATSLGPHDCRSNAMTGWGLLDFIVQDSELVAILDGVIRESGVEGDEEDDWSLIGSAADGLAELETDEVPLVFKRIVEDGYPTNAVATPFVHFVMKGPSCTTVNPRALLLATMESPAPLRRRMAFMGPVADAGLLFREPDFTEAVSRIVNKVSLAPVEDVELVRDFSWTVMMAVQENWFDRSWDKAMANPDNEGMTDPRPRVMEIYLTAAAIYAKLPASSDDFTTGEIEIVATRLTSPDQATLYASIVHLLEEHPEWPRGQQLLNAIRTAPRDSEDE